MCACLLGSWLPIFTLPKLKILCSRYVQFSKLLAVADFATAITDTTLGLMMYLFRVQLSMWRCSDELKQRAVLLESHAKKEAKHYVGKSLIH